MTLLSSETTSRKNRINRVGAAVLVSVAPRALVGWSLPAIPDPCASADRARRTAAAGSGTLGDASGCSSRSAVSWARSSLTLVILHFAGLTFRRVQAYAGATGLEPATCGFGDRCSAS